MVLRGNLKDKIFIYIIFLCYFPILFYTCVMFLYAFDIITQKEVMSIFGLATGYWKIVSAPFLSFTIMLLIVLVFSLILWKSIQKKFVTKKIAISLLLLSFFIAFYEALNFVQGVN